MGLKDTLIDQVGGAAGGIVQAGIGLALEQHNDRRQINQQKKLQDLQMQGQREMADYNYNNQLKMWDATNYKAQVEQMKKAGLNPALMYGEGGGGGATTNAAQGQGPSMASAPQGGGEIAMGLERGMQMQMMQAQIELAKSQANKNNVEATKTGGVDTQKVETEIQSLNAGIENTQADTKMKKVQEKLMQVDLGYEKATYDDRIDYITQQARQMTGLATQALVQGNLDSDARNTRLKTIKAEYVAQLLTNAKITAETDGIYQSIAESKEKVMVMMQQYRAIAQDLMLKWDSLKNDNERKEMLRTQLGYDTDPTNEVLEGISRGLGQVLTVPLGGLGSTPAPKPVGGFHKR